MAWLPASQNAIEETVSTVAFAVAFAAVTTAATTTAAAAQTRGRFASRKDTAKYTTILGAATEAVNDISRIIARATTAASGALHNLVGGLDRFFGTGDTARQLVDGLVNGDIKGLEVLHGLGLAGGNQSENVVGQVVNASLQNGEDGAERCRSRGLGQQAVLPNDGLEQLLMDKNKLNSRQN